jgi:hypothetical protein
LAILPHQQLSFVSFTPDVTLICRDGKVRLNKTVLLMATALLKETLAAAGDETSVEILLPDFDVQTVQVWSYFYNIFKERSFSCLTVC